ncbi:MAG: SigE family RNA polymerase sigma factor [Nocardioidaceae bacterium]
MADEVEFDEFVAARSRPLLKAAWALTGDWQLAEDLVQTALTKCYLRWGRFPGGEEAYVRRVLFTTYVTWWRRRWRGERPVTTVGETVNDHGPYRDADPDGDDPYVDVDLRRSLVGALGALPRRQRAVVVLRYYCDLSVVETAAELGCSTGTVKSQSAKALAALRESGLADLMREGTNP